MTHLDQNGTVKHMIRAERKSSPMALVIFAIAYLGVLIVIFAPKGTFATQQEYQQPFR
ncbi:MAG: hypothetical protein II336_06480 [Loktanella sp.]|nr:hypothetical protein [Loktanella sp.]